MNPEESANSGIVNLNNNPLFVQSSIAAWKNLSSHHDNYNIVISLMTISELSQCGMLNYIKTTQNAGKIFLHFPFNGRTDFNQINVLLSAIEKYSEDKILIYCPYNSTRIELFIACYMVYDGIKAEEVLKIFNLSSRHKKYVKRYAQKYLDL